MDWGMEPGGQNIRSQLKATPSCDPFFLSHRFINFWWSIETWSFGGGSMMEV